MLICVFWEGDGGASRSRRSFGRLRHDEIGGVVEHEAASFLAPERVAPPNWRLPLPALRAAADARRSASQASRRQAMIAGIG